MPSLRSPFPKSDSDPLFAFAATAFDRGGERREHANWLTALREDRRACVVTVAADGRVRLTGSREGVARTPLHDCVDPAALASASLLGFEAGVPLFAMSTQVADADEQSYADLRSIAATLPAHDAGVAAYARALLYWQARTRFCGRCGHPAALIAGGHRAKCGESACGEVFFPRTDAAVIVLVEHQGRALLGRQDSWGAGRFSTLAGFVEPGETLENAVRREIREESGVIVGETRYQASQPWPFPASLMIGFRAQALSDTIEVGDEIVEARWFSPDDVDRERAEGSLRISPAMSISRWLLGSWYRERTGRDLVD